MHLLARTKSVKHKPEIIMVLNIAALFLANVDKWNCDKIGLKHVHILITVTPMVAKMSSLFYCYEDSLKHDKELTQSQRELKVDKLPNLIELFSFVLFPGGAILAPFFEYRDYCDFVEQKNRYAVHKYSIHKSMEMLSYGILFIILHVFLGRYFKRSYMLTEDFYDSDFISK